MQKLVVKKLGKASVIVDIVDKGNFEIRPGYAMKPSHITIHNTGNSGRGANADMHNRYIHNMANLTPKDTGYASWHFSVDDKFIYQHIPLDESAWHTGDGSALTSGNRTSIGVEICENVDMKDYAQAEENAIALTVHLMKAFNIPVDKVKPHQAYSGKYCPRVILKRDGSFKPFQARIVEASKPVITIASTESKKEGVRMLQPSSRTLKGSVETFLREAVKDGHITQKWADDFDKGELSIDDAFALKLTVEQRSIVEKK